MKNNKLDALRVRRVALLILIYGGISVISLYLALLLRFDFVVPSQYLASFTSTISWFIPLKLVTLAFFGQFRTLLTYFSLPDAKRIGGAMCGSALIALALWYVFPGGDNMPRGVIVSDLLISFLGITFLRTSLRVYREQMVAEQSMWAASKKKRTAILGAGSSGAALLRDIQTRRGVGLDVVCFIDDDRKKIGGTLHGRKVLGPTYRLAYLAEELNLKKIIIAMPKASPVMLRHIVSEINKIGLDHDILPSIGQLLQRQVTVKHLRHVEPDDLLGRDPVTLSEHEIKKLIEGKTVLVTGAGGSIGSELCRQVASHNPKKLILIERSEPALFAIEQEITRDYKWVVIEPIATNVCNDERVQVIFAHEKPEIVFHAAAHKHVPLMERQPVEAILNNSMGTMIIAQAASKHGSQQMILVSTDKAVNPTNVMGATKRVAEQVVAQIQRLPENKTIFSSVRFGNVLGSSGSVIPTFHRQISMGGPVTVTHPEVTRYFMSIPEAVGLILQSATQAVGGEVFVLDMGDPIKITDLARQMIELTGFTPDEDIKIEFTGLRPGEKLYEEPIHEAENVVPTSHPKVKCLIGNGACKGIIEELGKIQQKLHSMNADELKQLLSKLVPEYKIWEG